ncbi:hypothetical protein SNE40_001022 [Patella caerulea]|uniref:Uncharacterized protein n=1 Tax=Patella caerulea TaxID=87958 RepID=A0AAN8G9L4_PATCE
MAAQGTELDSTFTYPPPHHQFMMQATPNLITSTPSQYVQQSISPTNQSGVPFWAQELLNNVQQLTYRTVEINNKLEELQQDVRPKIHNIQDNITVLRSEMSQISLETKHISEKTEKLESTILQMEDAYIQLKEDMVNIKARSMSNNLIFTNIPEDQNENPLDTEKKVRWFMVEIMKLPAKMVSEFQLERVNRFGDRRKSPRKICVQFLNRKDKDEVRYNAKVLKDTNHFVYEQFPTEIEDQRRKLVKVMKQKRLEEPGIKMKLVYNKLYINGSEYKA